MLSPSVKIHRSRTRSHDRGGWLDSRHSFSFGTHQDSEGNSGIIYPGLAQRMSAGSGILHSERNESPADPVHLVQMWVVPDETGQEPGYEQLEIEPGELENHLVVVAGGLPTYADRAAIRIRDRTSALLASRLAPGRSVQLPDAPYLHLYVPLGSVALEGQGVLDTGDAARMTASGGRRVTAGEDGAEILVWEMHAGMTLLDVRGH